MASVLTVRFVDTVAPPEKGRAVYADAALPGFVLRVNAGGSKSFSLRYRYRGEQQRLTWAYPAHGLAEAREAARKALQALARGDDPSAARRQASASVSLPTTISDLCDRYRDEHLKKNVRSWENNASEVEKHIRPALGAYPLAGLARAHVREMVKGIEAKGFPVAANRALVRIRAMLNWAMAEDLVEVNVAAGIKKPTKEAPRDRVLTDDELRAIWAASGDLAYPAQQFARLLMLTGQRRDDVRCMSWGEIDLDGALWIIPAARHKGKRPHLVPLAPAVLAILREMPFREAGGYVLSPTGGEKPYGNVIKPKAALDKGSGVTGWTLHDIRRTMRTGLSMLGINRDVAERVIGHAVGGRLGQTYDLWEFRQEKARALEAWERHLTGQPAENVEELVQWREAG